VRHPAHACHPHSANGECCSTRRVAACSESVHCRALSLQKQAMDRGSWRPHLLRPRLDPEDKDISIVNLTRFKIRVQRVAAPEVGPFMEVAVHGVPLKNCIAINQGSDF